MIVVERKFLIVTWEIPKSTAEACFQCWRRIQVKLWIRTDWNVGICSLELCECLVIMFIWFQGRTVTCVVGYATTFTFCLFWINVRFDYFAQSTISVVRVDYSAFILFSSGSSYVGVGCKFSETSCTSEIKLRKWN